MKPREWLLGFDDGELQGDERSLISMYGLEKVRVIEYAAYERLGRELAEVERYRQEACSELFKVHTELERSQSLLKTLDKVNDDLEKERDQARAEIERLEEIISYLPKVPTEPYEKALAKELLEARAEIERLKNELDHKEFTLQNTFNQWQKAMDGREIYEKALEEICDDMDADTHIPKRKIAREALEKGRK